MSSMLPQLLIAYAAVAVLVSAAIYLFADNPRARDVYSRAILWLPLLFLLCVVAVVLVVNWALGGVWKAIKRLVRGRQRSQERPL